MSEHSERDEVPEAQDDKSLQNVEKRLPILMAIVLPVMIAFSLTKADWRITSGIIFGGALAFLNYYWMKSSIAAVLQTIAAGNGKPSLIARYVLRYLVILCLVVLANELKLISVPATLIGLCTLAVAVLIEAVLQFYFVIVNKKG